jgi:hypothetical protein
VGFARIPAPAELTTDDAPRVLSSTLLIAIMTSQHRHKELYSSLYVHKAWPYNRFLSKPC